MKITNTQVWGFEGALRGMRNPKNSWKKNDTTFEDGEIVIGENDAKLSNTLTNAGTEHRKFLRMIHVQADFDMPRYWWSEADTYHFGTKDSCSTMHKLLNNNTPITKDMFVTCEEDDDLLEAVVERLEALRVSYKAIQSTTRDNASMERLLLRAKRLLPEGFLQMRTWDTNYEEIRNIYRQRKNHRLKEEWIDVWCKWAESLPYAKEFIIN